MQVFKHNDEDMAAYRKMMGLPPESKPKKSKEPGNAKTGGEQGAGAGSGQGEDTSPRALLEAKSDDEIVALALEQGIDGTDRADLIEKLLEKAQD